MHFRASRDRAGSGALRRLCFTSIVIDDGLDGQPYWLIWQGPLGSSGTLP
jgi:hypothetical protein